MMGVSSPTKTLCFLPRSSFETDWLLVLESAWGLSMLEENPTVKKPILLHDI